MAGCETFKVALMGSGGVGKSAITTQFVQPGIFVTEYDPSIEDSFRVQKEMGGITCFLDILDTAGQEEFSAMEGDWFSHGDGFILVFSVTDRNTFLGVDKYYSKLLRHKDAHDYPVVIAGNKCDLTEQRKVETREGEDKAAVWGSKAAYIETSAKTRQNVDELFASLVKIMREAKGSDSDGEDPKKKRRMCTLF